MNCWITSRSFWPSPCRLVLVSSRRSSPRFTALLNNGTHARRAFVAGFHLAAGRLWTGALHCTGVNRIVSALSLRVGREPDDAPPKLIPRMASRNDSKRTLAGCSRTLWIRGRDGPDCSNTFKLSLNGDEAFPAMLAAIEAATNSVSVATYIFDNRPERESIRRSLGPRCGARRSGAR